MKSWGAQIGNRIHSSLDRLKTTGRDVTRSELIWRQTASRSMANITLSAGRKSNGRTRKGINHRGIYSRKYLFFFEDDYFLSLSVVFSFSLLVWTTRGENNVVFVLQFLLIAVQVFHRHRNQDRESLLCFPKKSPAFRKRKNNSLSLAPVTVLALQRINGCQTKGIALLERLFDLPSGGRVNHMKFFRSLSLFCRGAKSLIAVKRLIWCCSSRWLWLFYYTYIVWLCDNARGVPARAERCASSRQREKSVQIWIREREREEGRHWYSH